MLSTSCCSREQASLASDIYAEGLGRSQNELLLCRLLQQAVHDADARCIVSLQVTKDAFQQLLGKEPKVAAIHAGLECGIIGEKVPGMDAVSYGPTITGAHSPDEQVSWWSTPSAVAFLARNPHCPTSKNPLLIH